MKKTEVLPAIEFNSIPFDLPEGWQWAGLGRLSRITEYGTSEKASEVKLYVPVLRMNNIEGGKIRATRCNRSVELLLSDTEGHLSH